MLGVSIFIFIGFCGRWSSALFLNNRPFPTYSLEDMPDTDFSCRDKIVGGYYADPQTQCQMFHICVKLAGVGVQDFRFLCPNSTAFDQEHQICANWEDVDCDVATLYYSSDNFDLYRIGSGLESKAVKYGEEEEPFALQRAESGDIRLNREHQTDRIKQQKEIKNHNRVDNPQHHQHTNQRNNNYNHNDSERDLFKGSSSSNFFNNRNSGKETDDYDYDSVNVNVNQNVDRTQRRKLIHRQRNKPQYEEPQTQKPDRPTGFINNFAGSSYTTTSRPIQTTFPNEQHTRGRGRQRQRGNYHYNSNNLRETTISYQEDDGQYHESRYTISTPAPFRRFQQRQKLNRFTHDDYSATSIPNTLVSSTERLPTSVNEQQRTSYNNNNNPYDNSQFRTSSNYPASSANTQITGKQSKNFSPISFEKQTSETENYSSTNFKQDKIYSSTPFINTRKETQSSSPSPFKQAPSYSPTPFQKPTGENNTSSTTFINTQQYSIAPFFKESRASESYFSTPFNQSPNSPNDVNQQTNSPYQNLNQDQNFQKQSSRFKNPTQFPSNNDSSTKYFPSNYEVTKNKQALEYSSTQNFKKQTTFAKAAEISPTTSPPKAYPVKTPENYSSTVSHKDLPSSQRNFASNYNNKQVEYNTGNAQHVGIRPVSTHAPYNPYSSQPLQTNTQTTRNFEFKRTTQHTHYTPTVPRVTTPYYSSTTRSPNSKRSNRFDETQYDDGSYNSKYDNEGVEKDNDEVLKTAHSTNFASSKNEYAQNVKNTQLSQTQKPRPFSITPNPPKESYSNNLDSKQIISNGTTEHTNNLKKSKEAAYDYAYYDSNVGHDHEYDIGIDIEKSSATKNKTNV